MMHGIKDNSAKSRFEMPTDGHDVYADYKLDGATLSLRYVFAAPELRGTGAAARLMEGIADHARSHDLKIIPICGYAAAWLRKHKEHHDLMA